MANIKLDGHTWDTSGVYDAEQAKTQKEINADVSDLKSALNEVRNFTPITPTWVTGGFYNTNGNLASNANFSYTAKANIPESTDGIYFKSVTSADLLNVVFWDSNDRKCGFGGGTGSAFAEHSELVPIPKNAVQYGLSKYNPSSINNFYTFAFDDVKCGVNIYEYSVPDGYLNANGNVNTETTGYFSCSGYIPLNENVKSVSYILCAITNLRTVCFYNANKVFISGVTYTQETPAMIKDCVPVPVGAKYMAFSYVNETYATTLDFSQCYVYLSDVPATVQNSDLRQKTWLAIGDSITVGYGNNNISYADYAANIMGITLNKQAVSGQTLSAIYGKAANGDYDNINADVITVLAGTNDWNINKIAKNTNTDTVYTANTYLGFVNSFIETMQAKFPNAQLVFLSCLQRNYSGSDTTNISGVTNGNNETLADYRNALKIGCDYHGVPVIDLYSEAGICALNLLPAESGYGTANIGTYTVDGLHPNELGHKRIATIVSEKLKDYV